MGRRLLVARGRLGERGRLVDSSRNSCHAGAAAERDGKDLVHRLHGMKAHGARHFLGKLVEVP